MRTKAITAVLGVTMLMSCEALDDRYMGIYEEIGEDVTEDVCLWAKRMYYQGASAVVYERACVCPVCADVLQNLGFDSYCPYRHVHKRVRFDFPDVTKRRCKDLLYARYLGLGP